MTTQTNTRVMGGLHVPAEAQPVVLYNSVTGIPFKTTQERKAYYLAKPAAKTIHQETGVAEKVTGVHICSVSIHLRSRNFKVGQPR